MGDGKKILVKMPDKPLLRQKLDSRGAMSTINYFTTRFKA